MTISNASKGRLERTVAPAPQDALALVEQGAVSGVTGMLAKLGAAIQSLVAWGYQDETGFHFGMAPNRLTISYPPFW
jgi:hypothetical protein